MWNFGDVIEDEPNGILVMVIGQNEGPAFEADDRYTIDTGDWVGVTLTPSSGDAFPWGKTTWIPTGWEWKTK